MRTSFFALTLLAVSLAIADVVPTPQDQAIRLMAQGRSVEARELVTRLIGEAETAEPVAGIPYRAALFEMLGQIENTMGRYGEAQRALEQGLALLEDHLPASSKRRVSLLVSLAEAHTASVKFQEADRALSRALAIATAELPPHDPHLATVLDGLGLLASARGETSRAEQFFRRALAVLETQLGPAHPDTAVESIALARLLLSSNRHAEAGVLIERSHQVLERAYGKSHPKTVFARYNLGLAHLKSSPAKAEGILRATLQDWLHAQPEGHLTTANILNALAVARLAQRDAAGAIAANARALDMLRALLGPEHPQLVAAMYDHARLLSAGKRGKEAAALRADADRIRLARGYAEPRRHTIDVNTLRRP